MTGERVKASYRPFSQGYPPQVIFRHGTQFFRTYRYLAHCEDVFVEDENASQDWLFQGPPGIFPGNNLKWITMKQKPV